MVLVGKQAPDFTAKAVVGQDFVDYTLSSNWKAKSPKYTLLFFYPLDFTFVCPTEIIAFSDRVKEFESRGVQVVGVSVDSEYSHLAWKGTPRAQGGLGDIHYPLVADIKKQIATAYDTLADDGTAFRGLFLVDQKGTVRHALVNDHPLGRSIDEALRIVDALQHHEKHGEVCPADWKPGEMAMVDDPVKSKRYFEAKNGPAQVTVKANGKAAGKKAAKQAW
ncbi:MAG TPA: peroxiredoxin [Candidatus Thermoplasmatota archaeon]|nr:peroxiredoxin [Candidatus Thermoplasmatota archaeon]